MNQQKRILLSLATGLAFIAAVDFGLWFAPMLDEYLFVAQGSGDSMEPTFEEGDIIVVEGVTEPSEGDLIAFTAHYNGEDEVVIHRAAFHVEEGENWYEQADPSLTDHESCDDSPACPARSSGWITVGDNEDVYDQERDLPAPVDDDEIEGRAVFVW